MPWVYVRYDQDVDQHVFVVFGGENFREQHHAFECFTSILP